jgi:hypothetical protein
MFDPDDLDAACAELDRRHAAGEAAQPPARFAGPRPDALRIPPNAAWRARERCLALLQARDWDGMRALATADFRYEDRQKHALVTGDVETWIKSAQEATSWPSWRMSNTLLGTAGERIMVERQAWAGEPNTGVFEIDHLRLIEVTPDGRFVAWINFDVEDRGAAFVEADARFVTGEAAGIGGQAPFAALNRALAYHDWDAIRGCIAADAVFCDRRVPAVLGTLDRDQSIDSLRALIDMAPDARWESSQIVAWNQRGRVDVIRQFGVTLDGGPFEQILVRVFLSDGARIQHCELFDVAETEAALARFSELCRTER